MENPEDNIILLQLDKEITSVFKRYLELLDELQFEHNQMLEKLRKYVPDDEIIDTVNYLTPEKHDLLRKQILDAGNGSIRNLSTFLGYFNFVINSEKLKTAASNRKIVKRFSSSAPLIIE